MDSSKKVKKIISKWLLNEGIKKPGLEFNFRWAPIGLRTTEWVLSHLQTLMLDLACLLILQFLIVLSISRKSIFLSYSAGSPSPDRRKGEELHVLETLQRKVENWNTSFTFLRIFLFVWSSVSLYVPANILREFRCPVACWLYLRMSSYLPVVKT